MKKNVKYLHCITTCKLTLLLFLCLNSSKFHIHQNKNIKIKKMQKYINFQQDDNQIMNIWNHIFELRMKNKWREDPRSYEHNSSSCENKPEKIRLAGTRTLTSAIPVQRSNQLSLQANWELVIKLVRNIPGKDEDQIMNIWNHTFELRMKNKWREDPRSYEHNLSSCENIPEFFFDFFSSLFSQLLKLCS